MALDTWVTGAFTLLIAGLNLIDDWWRGPAKQDEPGNIDRISPDSRPKSSKEDTISSSKT